MAEGFNRDHHTDGMIVDGWIGVTFPKTIEGNAKFKTIIRPMLELLRGSFSTHPDLNPTFGEANLGRGEGNFVTHGANWFADYDPTPEDPYYREWITRGHDLSFRLKYSIAVKDEIVAAVNNELKKYDDALDTGAPIESPRMHHLKEDLAAFHLTPDEIAEITNCILTDPVYEFDLFRKGQDIYVSAYIVRHGGPLGCDFESKEILDIIKGKTTMDQ